MTEFDPQTRQRLEYLCRNFDYIRDALGDKGSLLEGLSAFEPRTAERIFTQLETELPELRESPHWRGESATRDLPGGMPRTVRKPVSIVLRCPRPPDTACTRQERWSADDDAVEAPQCALTAMELKWSADEHPAD